MKQLFFIALLSISLHFTGYSQTVRKTIDGNYIAVKDTTASSNTGTATGKTYTDTKGNVYDVYVSARGKFFIRRVSKTGNTYNQYLKIN